MEIGTLLLLIPGIFTIAVLYSSIGHAGASGYIAVLSLFALSPEVIRPAALVLNVGVSLLTFWNFHKAGHFSWPLLRPFLLLSIPFAFLGGWLQLPSPIFRIVVGMVLILSGLRFIFGFEKNVHTNSPTGPVAYGSGAGLGLLAGLTGTGGGIFLTPLLLFNHWATPKKAAAASSLFILGNSLSGLGGNITATLSLPLFTLPLIAAALAGGAIGSRLGSFHLPSKTIKQLLAVVLLIAGLKLIFTT